MADQKRRYELRQRADAMDETRRRIVDAVVELHGTVGPARTTVAGIATRAGVQRHTVYRHFPDDDALITACSGAYWDRHPWPRAASWTPLTDPAERLAVALRLLHAHYADTAPMLSNVLRDAAVVPAVHTALDTLHDHLDDVVDSLTPGLLVGRPGRDELVRGVLRHVTAFPTWESLRASGVPAEEAVRLLVGMVALAAEV